MTERQSWRSGVGNQMASSGQAVVKIAALTGVRVAVAFSLLGCGAGISLAPRGPATESFSTAVVANVTRSAPRAPASDDPSTAVVRIEAEGTFEDAWEGLPFSSSGSGSGFLISPDGEILTNAHVVLGASLMRVFVPGSIDARAGRVISVDECSDLALIKIEGGNFPYLALATGDPAVRDPVLALGYAHGRPTLATTPGSVLDIRADGTSGWAALGHTIQHTAELHPGNSGGPLLAANNTVVGVNYSADDEGGAWAVPISIVNELLPQLRAGSSTAFVTGINGQAFTSFVSGVTGVFASSVASGSAADKAGVLPGDLVMKLERLPLAQDGTVKKYCDVLRSHAQSAVLAVQVYRRTDHVLLAGQLNGDLLAEVKGELPEPAPPQFAPQAANGMAIPELYDAGMHDVSDLAADPIQNGMDTLFFVDDLREQPVGLRWGWCADSQDRLEQNWEHFSILFVADGQPYSADNLFTWDSEDRIDVAGRTDVAAFCRTVSIALDTWGTGVHRLVASAYLDSPISDGWRDYYESDVHTSHYEIRVNGILDNRPDPATPTLDPNAVPLPDIGTVTYKVKAGDTLSRLAKLFNTTVTVLMQLNQMVGEPLFVGQNLVVPGSAPQTLPVPGEGVLFDVGTKVIKLADPGGRRYLKVGIVLEFAPHDTAWYSMAPEQRAKLQALFETAMGSKQPVIEDLVISIISSKSYAQVYTLEGKEGLRQEIINRINQLLPTQLVMYVYFNEYVVQ